jgi:uncharacterized protein YjaG (DUF416 family)
MNETLNRKTMIKIALTVLLVGVFIYLAAAIIVKEQTNDLTSLINVQVAEQQALIKSIAETTARNGADQVTESIVRDCTVDERTTFDTLLGRLNAGLGQTELVELERLFGRCGSFFAERKLVMSSRLAREVQVYEDYVAQLATLTGADTIEEYDIPAWKQLTEQEIKMSTDFSILVDLQDEIITTLIAGKARDSEEIQAILSEVQDTQDSLTILNAQTATIRTELIAL